MWLSLLLSCAGSPMRPTATSELGDLQVHLEVSGELEARKSVDIVNPLEGWSELDFVVEEGTRVEAGDVVLRFKTEETLKQLEEAKASRDVALTRVEQAEARLQLQLGEAEAKIVLAELDEQMAAFRQSDSETVPRVERAQARIAAEQARIVTSEADTHVAKIVQDARAEIEVLQLEVVRAERQVAKLQERIDDSEVEAPAPGVVLVGKRWGRETFRAGHDVYQGATILQLPNLEHLDVKAWVHETDAPKIAVGQQAEVTLDANPDTVIDGVISSVAPIVVPRGEQGIKQLGVELTLSETTEQMKPGMTVSVDLVVQELEGAVLLPAAAVAADRDGTFVRSGRERIPVTVLAESDEQVAVEGLSDGVTVELPSTEDAP